MNTMFCPRAADGELLGELLEDEVTISGHN